MADQPLNGGFICEKHKIGYIGKCPTCLALENPPRPTKKQQKKVRQLLRKHGRK